MSRDILYIESRIKLLTNRKRENSNIVRKLQRELRKQQQITELKNN